MSKRSTVNRKARKKIADICRENNWTRCEIRLGGCLGEAHAPAHRHKRRWYLGKEELLSDIGQWVPACQNCHQDIEYNKKLTQEIFIKLRGEE